MTLTPTITKADATTPESDTEAPEGALDAWVRVWADTMLADSIGERLTCEEADTVAALLETRGQGTAAQVWLVAHSQDDDEGDAHFDLRQQDTPGFE